MGVIRPPPSPGAPRVLPACLRRDRSLHDAGGARQPKGRHPADPGARSAYRISRGRRRRREGPVTGVTTPASTQAHSWMSDLAGILDPGEDVTAFWPSDLHLDGTFGEAWCVLTNRRMLAWDGPAPRLGAIRGLELAAAREWTVRRLYGNSYLVAEQDGVPVELCRFSQTLLDSFESAAVEAAKASALAREETPARSAPKERRATRCPTCGRAYPPGSDTCPFCVDRQAVLWRLVRYLKPYWWRSAVVLALTLANVGAGLIGPVLSGNLVGAVQNRDLHTLWVIVAIQVGAGAFSLVSSVILNYQNRWLGQKIIEDLRTEVYTHLQGLALEFYNKKRTGTLITRVTGDTAQLQTFLTQGVPQTLVQISTIVGVVITLFGIDWKLALVGLIPTPVLFIGTRIFNRGIRPVYRRIWSRLASVNAIIGDTIPGIVVVKAFTREGTEVTKFRAGNERVFSAVMAAARREVTFYPFLGWLVGLGGAAIWGYGGYEVITGGGHLNLAHLVQFIGLMGAVYGPVQAMSTLSGQVMQAATASERVFEIMDTQPESAHVGHIVPPRFDGRVTFEHVSFRYGPEEEALRDISLDFLPGQTVGLVGPSGSGKSTLAQLILRFYDVSDGRLLIDGRDIREYDLNWLRRNIGIVLQEPFLFHGTIEANIAYGRPDASHADIVRAAKIANAHPFIMDLPDAYDTLLGERGVGLSGGQRQRISIARAVLKDPKILILDEATSAVDTETEALIQEATQRLIAGRTTIAIAHRLSTLREADVIVVIEDGHVSELGSHEELLERDGTFAKLWRMQTEMQKRSQDVIEFKR